MMAEQMVEHHYPFAEKMVVEIVEVEVVTKYDKRL